jgi:hypothetical protein
MTHRPLDPVLYPEEIGCKTLDDQLEVENIIRNYFEAFRFQNHSEEA